jgi:hypothetical protein
MALTGYKLKPLRRQMAKSMLNLFNIIAAADLRTLSVNPNATLIFPPSNVPLQQAITTVKAQLTTVLSL